MPLSSQRLYRIAGVGYYTAILAHLVGPTGRVTGIEYASDLANRARVNLATLPQVEIREGDGTTIDFDAADVIYVNAGATHPADTWLDRLVPGGRLILPLTTEQGFSAGRSADQVTRTGAVFRIERRAADYAARCISSVAVFPCVGGREAKAESALVAAFEKGSPQDVSRLYRHEEIPEARCWLRGQSWCLAYD